ncbi:MAG TPA: LuxR C-terminal-related transcriptional regulator [Thiobacillaceae bacterium]|nr:LuxR C-terminal-related transcriptional regulator [Thiobacillaceae bacterium]
MPRERDALDKIRLGKLNKAIATHLDLCVRTAEVHRAKIMKKMGAPTWGNRSTWR